MINILVLNSDTDGVGYYRLLNPHLCLSDNDIQIDVRLLSDSTLPLLDINFMSKYNILVYNKIIPFSDQNKEIMFYDIIQKLNIKIVYDIDDYWKLDFTHINFKNWTKNKSSEKIESILRKSDIITTTTEIFASELRKINPNVVIIPNAININENQWIHKQLPNPGNRLRFIWGGGISHQVDLKLLLDDFKKLNKNFLNKSQMIMCGYDLRMKMSDGSITKDSKQRSQWGKFESIFTNTGQYITNVDYREFLKNSDNFDNDDKYGYNELYLDNFYQRRHTKPIGTYGTMYNEADVCLAPLKNNHSFNKMKSQLKLIEAGAHGLPIIMSKTGPYLIDDIEKNGLGIYVEEGVDSWGAKMQWYLDNPNAVKEHGLANQDYFLEHFEMKKVNNIRRILYKNISTQDRDNVKL